MTEEFLHYIWKYRLLDSSVLKTASGEIISILSPGIQNHDSGPDFFDARVKIDNTLWAGNVEIHINASSWEKHNHHKDSAYNNVILHVVHQNDSSPKKENGLDIPTLVLKDKFNKKIFERYEYFILSKSRIPCGRMLSGVEEIVKIHWLERLAIERLQRKTTIILDDLKFYNNNWAEVFYIHLAKNFGLKINSEPFFFLARSLPYSILGRHKDNLRQMEALLFGQAGFLDLDQKKLAASEEKATDRYYLALKKEYDFLRKKYSLTPMDFHLWKFLRLRPASFPTIRISQFASLLYKSSNLFSLVIESGNVREVKGFFDVKASDYWNTHFNFGKLSPPSKIISEKRLGPDTAQSLTINSVVPFLFVYGKQKVNSKYETLALKFLESLPKENNAITRQFAELGFKNDSAFESQALVEMKNEYCTKKKCLDCFIGARLIRN